MLYSPQQPASVAALSCYCFQQEQGHHFFFLQWSSLSVISQLTYNSATSGKQVTLRAFKISFHETTTKKNSPELQASFAGFATNPFLAQPQQPLSSPCPFCWFYCIILTSQTREKKNPCIFSLLLQSTIFPEEPQHCSSQPKCAGTFTHTLPMESARQNPN